MGQVSNHLACMWRVEIKGEKSIKEEAMREKDRKFVRESIVAAWTTFVIIFNQYILEQISSDCADDKFT